MKLKIILTALLCLPFLSACASRAEREFKNGCESGGATSSQCSCIYDKMKDHYHSDVMDKFGENAWAMPNDFIDVMAQSALQCRAE